MVFNGRTKVGMYMHMSCLVERLVIKEPIEAREEIEKFKIEQGKFIKIVKESFEKISKHYGVEIPVSEIAYFYDYIMADKNLQ
jgi:sigma-54 dependent transcriptional regulator of gfr operon